MEDYGTRYTDRAVEEVRERVERVYREASRDIAAKMDSFTAHMKAKDQQMRADLAAGKITQQDYKNWMSGQFLESKRWKERAEGIARTLTAADEKATQIINGQTLDVFSENANFMAFKLDQGAAGAGISWTLYDSKTVERLIRDEPELLIRREIDGRKADAWHVREISNAVTQAIIQGESIPQLSARIARDTSISAGRSSMLYARTAMTSAQNAGRIERMRQSRSMGINVTKVWMSAGDDRVRESHEELDGQEAKIDEPFDSILGPIDYPGDPSAEAENVWNCRCCLGYNYPDHVFDVDEWEDADEDDEFESWIDEVEGHGSSREHVVAQGQDITETWERREGQFDFAIDDVLQAQGFDGLPTVVSGKEFDRAVAEANGGQGFVAQRGYRAPDAETLEAYRQQLYDGKWYVDCSSGGAMFGQGMYAAANFEGAISQRLQQVSSGYANSAFSRVETFTMTPDAKLVQYSEVSRAFHGSQPTEGAIQKMLSRLSEDERTFAIGNMQTLSWLPERHEGVTFEMTAEAFRRIGSDKAREVTGAIRELSVEAERRSAEYRERFGNIGVFAAAKGYDGMVCGDRSEDGVYIVVLNRTKCIFRGDDGD